MGVAAAQPVAPAALPLVAPVPVLKLRRLPPLAPSTSPPMPRPRRPLMRPTPKRRSCNEEETSLSLTPNCCGGHLGEKPSWFSFCSCGLGYDELGNHSCRSSTL